MAALSMKKEGCKTYSLEGQEIVELVVKDELCRKLSESVSMLLFWKEGIAAEPEKRVESLKLGKVLEKGIGIRQVNPLR